MHTWPFFFIRRFREHATGMAMYEELFRMIVTITVQCWKTCCSSLLCQLCDHSHDRVIRSGTIMQARTHRGPGDVTSAPET